MRSSADSVHLQALLDAAALSVADGCRPLSSDLVHKLKVLMDSIQPEHLGLQQAVVSQGNVKDSTVIRTQIVYETEGFELCIFKFPRGVRLPLHDHPKMTVFSKVLYGALAMQSYDWDDPLIAEELAAIDAATESQQGGKADVTQVQRPVTQRADTILTPEAPTFCLQPSFANIHCFEALSECAVLDLLLPPYDDDAGRACHYFEAVDWSDARKLELILSEPLPGTLNIQGEPYRGPKLHPRRA